MPATLTTVTALVKEIYEDDLREQLNNDVVALNRVEKTSEGVTSEVGGKYVTFPIHTGRNAGIGARNELDALPTPGNQATLAARVGLKYLYGSVRLTGQLFELVKSNKQAFISALDLELNGLKTDLQVDLERQVYGNNIGGIVSITAAVTAVTFSVKHTTWLQVGEVVDVTDVTGVTIKAAARTVVSFDENALTVTISGANVAVIIGDLLTRTASSTKEWTGLGSIVLASGALYNVTDPTWQATVDANGGTNRPLSEGLMTKMVHTIRRRGAAASVGFCSLGVQRSYANLLTQQRRFVNTATFTGGYGGIEFTTDKGPIPIVADVYAPPNLLYFLTEKELKWYREEDWAFMDRDGSMWNRVSGFDAYDGTMFQYSELGTHRRNAHGVIQDITES